MHAAYGGSFFGGSIREAAQRCPCLAEPEGTGEITCKLPVEWPGGAGPAALRGVGGRAARALWLPPAPQQAAVQILGQREAPTGLSCPSEAGSIISPI